MKTVLLVPGFTEDYHSRDYAALQRAIEACGYKVTFVPIQWKQTTIDDWVTELERVYADHDPENTVLAGFSYGSMTAFLVATKRCPSELWLFSLSPYFAEDLKSKNMKEVWLRQIGKRRVTAFSQLNFELLGSMLDCKTLLFIGEKELRQWPIMQERYDSARKQIKNCQAIVVPHAGHDCTQKDYIRSIRQSIE